MFWAAIEPDGVNLRNEKHSFAISASCGYIIAKFAWIMFRN